MNSLYARLIILYEVVLIPLKCYTETINTKISSITNFRDRMKVRFVCNERIVSIIKSFATYICHNHLFCLSAVFQISSATHYITQISVDVISNLVEMFDFINMKMKQYAMI